MSGFLVAIVLMLFAVIVALNFTTGEKKIEQSVERLYAAADPAFARAMGVLLGPAILPGNRFEALLNGDRIFPAMLAAIRDAKKTITFESYIYWSDAIGKEFADALTERARAGVKVHVLLDWVGSNKMDPTHLAAMEAAGVEVRKFHKPDWYSLARMNNRTHRKVLVVDGKLGFTGGVGIAGLWTGDAQDPQHWRDTHFRAEGRRDVDDYLRLARENHLTIAYVLETHRQEDFEFGSRTLAQMTGARIVGGNHTLFGEMDVKLADKQELKVGSTRFIAVEFVDVGWAILVVLLDLDCPRLTHPRCVSARRKRRYL